jgi:uncharacterized protein
MSSPNRPNHPAPSAAMTEAELDELQECLDQLPAPFEPLDVCMLDGYLCGVLLQPQSIPAQRWIPYIIDIEGRAHPPKLNTERLTALVRKRHTQLDQAIQTRDWFDPWVFELDGANAKATFDETQSVYPWVAGFALSMDLFPALMQSEAANILEPLALLYQHLDPNDLEDADALLAEIDTLEPPQDLGEAVENLVRAVMLLADTSRPQGPKPHAGR